MKQISFNIKVVFFFIFACSLTSFARAIDLSNDMEIIENDENIAASSDSFDREFYNFLNPEAHAQCTGCNDILGQLKKNFSELILYESFTIPQLNSDRASLSKIENLGIKFGKRLINSIKQYNPSLNVNQLKKKIRDLIARTALGLRAGNLNNQNIRNKINKDFRFITNFWKKHIFANFQASKANSNFSKALNIIAKLNSTVFNRLDRRFRDNQFSAYQQLIASILTTVNTVEHA